MIAARATVTLTTAVVVALLPRLVLEDGCRRMALDTHLGIGTAPSIGVSRGRGGVVLSHCELDGCG